VGCITFGAYATVWVELAVDILVDEAALTHVLVSEQHDLNFELGAHRSRRLIHEKYIMEEVSRASF
jgi:hypothetical protein